MDIFLKTDIAKLQKSLKVAADQVPYATALALTAVAKKAAADVTAQLPSIFDRPTPFTMRALVTTPATKATLTATVNIRPQQSSYLAIQETGGTETPPGTAFILPIGVTLNAYGNIGRGKLTRMLGKKKSTAFIGTEHGIGGYWQRLADGKLKLLAEFIKKRSYKPVFPYHKMVSASVAANLPTAVADAVKKAMATARKS